MSRTNQGARSQESGVRSSHATAEPALSLPRGGNPLLAAFFIIGALLVPPAAFAQVAAGLPPYGSFSGGSFDTVNNANLNVNFAIPIIRKAGRGLPFNYTLTYNSSVWYPQSTGASYVWANVSNWGWNTMGGEGVGYLQATSYSQYCLINYVPYVWMVYHFGPYIDPSGASHNVSVYTNTAQAQCGVTAVTSGQSTATDGSGMTLAVSSTTTAIVNTPSGLAINAVAWNGNTAPLGGVTISDTNGNSINATPAPLVFTDTLGLTALSISGSGTPSSPITYAYTNPQGTTSPPITVNYIQKPVETNFGCPSVTDYGRTTQMTKNLVSSISLPDGTSYSFTYESTPNPVHAGAVTGRLASVTLPTGGAISYTYTGGSSGHITCTDGTAATLRRSTPDTGSNYWQYVHSENGSAWTTDVTDPQGNLAVMNFQGTYETKRKVYQGGVTILKTIDTCYNGASIPCISTAITLPVSNRTVQVTLPNLSPSKTYTTYNTTYGLPTETDEYTYGPSLTRKTLTSYTGCGVSNSHVHDRPCSVKLYDGGGVLKAETDNTYSANGNLLTEARSTGGSPASISRSFTYSSNGVLLTSQDFNGHTTTYSSFTCASNTAFPQTVTSGGLTTTLTWDCNGGVVTSVTDTSNNTPPTQFIYNDPNHFWRVTEVDYPDQGKLTTTYTDTQGAFSVAGSRLVSTGVNHLTTQRLDSLGRVNQVEDNSAGTYVDTHYDSLGRVYSVSNPHFSGGSPSDGITYYSYDALGRPADVGTAHAIKYPDGNYTSITYSGNCATAADPAGKTRKTCTDALGRITSVTEDPTGLNYSTSYTYDVLDNLKTVAQGSQTRNYNYDWLSRATGAQTPETNNQWTYFYYTTAGGALCSGDPNAVCRRDAPAPNQTNPSVRVVTTYAYDALNRLTGKTYSDSTPPATFSYDQTSVTIGSWSSGTLANPKGRLTEAVTTSGGNVQTAVVYSYDAVGRPADYWQCTPFNCGNASIWQLQYNYDLAGDLAGYVHPAGYTITNTISAAQRITEISSTRNDSTHPPVLAQNITYTPWGALSTLQNGCVGTNCTIQETYDYNNRLQPVRLQLGTPTNNPANYCLVYNYYSGSNPSSCAVPSQGTGNNGNVMGSWYQDNWNSSFSHTAAYAYDNVNRLGTAVATGNSTYNLTFSYDRYGNMSCVTNGQTNGPCPNWTYDPNLTNRISTSGFGYDAAGNLTADGTHSYEWDGEGRLVTVDNGATIVLVYNALGQQVGVTKGGTDVVWHLKSPADKSQGDYAPSYVGWNPAGVFFLGEKRVGFDVNGGMVFLHQNNLNSVTVPTTFDGSVFDDIQYYPWGQYWAGEGFVFAGMDHYWQDVLHNTPNRQYAFYEGRWLSPDPLGGDVTNPQSLNRYAYVLNNPTSLTDPLGLAPPTCGSDDPGCQNWGIEMEKYAFMTELYAMYDLEAAFGLGFASDYNSQPGGGSFNWYQFSYTWYGQQVDMPLGTTLDQYADFVTSFAVMYPLSQPGNVDAALGQCGSVRGNLSGNFPGTGASVNCTSVNYVQGSHANFSITCGNAMGGDCAGRWAGGLHIETNGKGDFWGHNDTASYYIGQSFNWGTFSPWNLFLHGGVDYLWGSLVITMFPY